MFIKVHELRLLNNPTIYGYRLKFSNKEVDIDASIVENESVIEALYKHRLFFFSPIYGQDMGDYLRFIEKENDTSREISLNELLTYLNKDTDIMTLDSVAKARFLKCRNICYRLNIPLQNISEINVNKRLKSCWGRCSKSKTSKNTFIIELSAMMMDIVTSYTDIDNTLIHELLHTCPNCFNHGYAWKYYANVIFENEGINIETLVGDEQNDTLSIENIINMGYYAVQCLGCGYIISRPTCNTGIIKYPERYRCTKCKSDFIRII